MESNWLPQGARARIPAARRWWSLVGVSSMGMDRIARRRPSEDMTVPGARSWNGLNVAIPSARTAASGPPRMDTTFSRSRITPNCGSLRPMCEGSAMGAMRPGRRAENNDAA
jgi:hypothetical protein